MNKRILIFCTVLAAFGLSAFSYQNWSNAATAPTGATCSKPAAPTLQESMYYSPLIDAEIALNNPYELTYKVVQTGADQYKLVTNM
jgi:hypothetical protein